MLVLGEQFYGLIQAPKHFVRVARAGHNDIGSHARDRLSLSNEAPPPQTTTGPRAMFLYFGLCAIRRVQCTKGHRLDYMAPNQVFCHKSIA